MKTRKYFPIFVFVYILLLSFLFLACPSPDNGDEIPVERPLYTGYAATDTMLWYTPMDTVNITNYLARNEVTDATSQQSGSDISIDFDPGSGLLYVGYVAVDGKLWYTIMDTANPSNYIARTEVCDDTGPVTGQQSGSRISVDFDPDSSLLYVGWVATDNTLWYTPMDTVTPTNYLARNEITDDTAPPAGQQSGTDISIDFDPVSSLLYVGWVATDDKLWYTPMDTVTTTNYIARNEITDATNPQSGGDISITFDSVSSLLYVGWVATDNKLWYTPMDTTNTANLLARNEITDADAPPTGQQSGTAIGIFF